MTSPIPPEPQEQAALVMVGPDGEERVYIRDDRGLEIDDDCWWWLVDGTKPVVGYRWSEVIAYGNVVRLSRPEEVAQAVRDSGLTVVGEHIIERGGYCRTDGVHHSPEEIARLEDRLAEEDGRG